MPYPSTVQSIVNPVTFYVYAGDPNINDTLYGEWVTNYPEWTSASRLIPTEPQTNRTPAIDYSTFSRSFKCTDFQAASSNSLAFVVSDHPFLDMTDAAVKDPAHRYNLDSNGTPVLTMLSWTIIGCQ